MSSPPTDEKIRQYTRLLIEDMRLPPLRPRIHSPPPIIASLLPPSPPRPSVNLITSHMYSSRVTSIPLPLGRTAHSRATPRTKALSSLPCPSHRQRTSNTNPPPSPLNQITSHFLLSQTTNPQVTAFAQPPNSIATSDSHQTPVDRELPHAVD